MQMFETDIDPSFDDILAAAGEELAEMDADAEFDAWIDSILAGLSEVDY